MSDVSTIGNAYIPVPDVNANTNVNGYFLHLSVAAIAPPTSAAAAPVPRNGHGLLDTQCQ